MNHRTAQAGAAALLMIAVSPVFAQDLSSEVGPATVWFALLVVIFALLVAIGLYMAQDREKKSQQDATPTERADTRSKTRTAPNPRSQDARITTRNTEPSRNKQQEYS